MKIRKWSFLYSVLSPAVYIHARLFYRRWIVLGRENFPANDEPVIIVSNHQNALLDPLLCCLTAPRQLHFLTRADVFKNPKTRPFIYALNMMPVYRFRDKMADMGKRNDRTFKIAIARLKLGAALGIFPEGNHGGQKILRPLKKGLAHLLELAKETQDLQGVKIVPVAVDYSEYDRARSSLVVNYGDPFTLDEVLFSDAERVQRQRGAMEVVREKLSNAMLDLGPNSLHPFLRLAEGYLTVENGYSNWKLTQTVLHRLREELRHHESDEDILEDGRQLFERCAKERLEPRALFMASASKAPWSFIEVIFPFILALPAFVVYALPWQLALALTRKVVVDPHFNSTFRLVFGMLLMTTTTIAVGITLLFLLTPAQASLGLLAIIGSGIIALRVSDMLIDNGQYRRAKRLLRADQPFSQRFERLKNRLTNLVLKSDGIQN